MSQSLAGGLEELVLTGLCWNTDLASQIVLRGVTADVFTTRYFRTIAKAAIDHVVRYSEAPRNHLADILEAELNRAETGKQLWQAIGRMEQVQAGMQVDYVLNELESFLTSFRLRKVIANAADLIHKGKLHEAQEALQALGAADPELTTGIWMNEPEQALAGLYREDNDEFNLGIQELDKRGVRPARKTILVFLAPKKRGKSMALVGVGKQAAYHDRKHVLHICLEMSAEQTALRYAQSICGWTKGEVQEKTIRVPMFRRDETGGYIGVDFDVIKPENLNPSTVAMASEKLLNVSRGRRRLLIKEFPTGTLTTARLNMFLEYLKRTEKWEPDLILVDYANLMRLNADNLRTETGRVFRDLRGIAVERNVAMVTATQGNRLSETAKIVGATHLSEDWSIAGTVDILVSICRTPDEKDRRLARLFVAAARDVADQFVVMITQNYDCCQFAIDSVYMNRHCERDLQKMMDEDTNE